MIKISYDREGDLLEIRFSDKKIRESEYIEQSGIVADFDESGKLVGIEIVSFSKRAAGDSFPVAVAVGE